MRFETWRVRDNSMAFDSVGFSISKVTFKPKYEIANLSMINIAKKFAIQVEYCSEISNLASSFHRRLKLEL